MQVDEDSTMMDSALCRNCPACSAMRHAITVCVHDTSPIPTIGNGSEH